MKNKPTEFDLYLGSIYYGKIDKHNLVNDFAGLTFYIIKERFYDCFLSIPEHDNLDRALKGKGKFFVCNPFTVIQHSGFSDHAQKYCNYDKYLIKSKLYGVSKN